MEELAIQRDAVQFRHYVALYDRHLQAELDRIMGVHGGGLSNRTPHNESEIADGVSDNESFNQDMVKVGIMAEVVQPLDERHTIRFGDYETDSSRVDTKVKLSGRDKDRRSRLSDTSSSL